MQLIRLTERSVFVRTVQGRLVAAGYQLRHRDRFPSLTHHHRCHRRMLTERAPKLEPQHRSHAILNESMVRLYHSGRRVRNDLVAFQQHDSLHLNGINRNTPHCLWGNWGHQHSAKEGWPGQEKKWWWTIKKCLKYLVIWYPNENRLDWCKSCLFKVYD